MVPMTIPEDCKHIPTGSDGEGELTYGDYVAGTVQCWYFDTSGEVVLFTVVRPPQGTGELSVQNGDHSFSTVLRKVSGAQERAYPHGGDMALYIQFVAGSMPGPGFTVKWADGANSSNTYPPVSDTPNTQAPPTMVPMTIPGQTAVPRTQAPPTMVPMTIPGQTAVPHTPTPFPPTTQSTGTPEDGTAQNCTYVSGNLLERVAGDAETCWYLYAPGLVRFVVEQEDLDSDATLGVVSDTGTAVSLLGPGVGVLAVGFGEVRILLASHGPLANATFTLSWAEVTPEPSNTPNTNRTTDAPGGAVPGGVPSDSDGGGGGGAHTALVAGIAVGTTLLLVGCLLAMRRHCEARRGGKSHPGALIPADHEIPTHLLLGMDEFEEPLNDEEMGGAGGSLILS